LPITGIDTSSMIASTFAGSGIRATPDSLQRHHGDRTHVLGDARLFARDDVHDDAALLHPREPTLHEVGPAAQVLQIGRFRHTRPLARTG